MTMARGYHSAAVLQDGSALITGGFCSANGNVCDGFDAAAADLYDPATGRFTRVGNMHDGRSLHTSTTLDDHKAT